MSDLIKDRIDLKSLTFQCFNTAIEVLKSNEFEGISVSPNTSLVILTDFGIIQGSYIPNLESEDDSNESAGEIFVRTITGKVFEIRNKRLVELKSENPELKLINDSSSIVLSDVTITPYSNPSSKSHIGLLTLFTDQIVGFSFGEYSETTD